jgi:phosphate-selective porin
VPQAHQPGFNVTPTTLRLGALIGAGLLFSSAATADVVTGTVSPDKAKVVIVDAAGKEVATLASGPYQLQLPVGKFTARCEAPKAREQTFLSLSEPVTVNIACN